MHRTSLLHWAQHFLALALASGAGTVAGAGSELTTGSTWDKTTTLGLSLIVTFFEEELSDMLAILYSRFYNIHRITLLILKIFYTQPKVGRKIFS